MARVLLPWVYSALFWLGVGVILALHEYAVWLPEHAPWPWALRDAAADWGAFVPLTPPLFALLQRQLRHRQTLLARAGMLALLLLAFTLAHTVVQATIVQWLPSPPWARGTPPATLSAAIARHLERTAPMVATRYVAVIAVGVALALRRTSLAREREAQELREQYLQAQLQVLRAQLQPHFLFNTLHTIGVSVRHDPDGAARMVVLLGDLLRGALQTRGDQLVPLREELTLLDPYLQILALRYRDRLTVTVDVPAEMRNALVPDLLLQPLVENAIRHGIEARAGVGHIDVRAERRGEDLVLIVRDDGAGPAADAGEGTGLGNTRARLRALYGDAAVLTLEPGPERGAVATVRLPWRRHRDATP